MCRNESQTSEPDDDAQFAVSQFSSWIMNADTKAGLLAMALTVLTGAALGHRDRFAKLMPPGDLRAWFGLSCGMAAAVAVVATVGHLLGVTRPNVATNTFSRFSWPSVAQASPDDILRRGSATRRTEAWETACVLAMIADRKFIAWRRALGWWIIACATLIGAIFLAS